VRHTRAALTAMAATLAVALAGCAGSTTAIEDLSADAVFLSAVDRSTDISTIRVRYESTSRSDGEVLQTGGGEAIFAPGAVSFTFTMGGFRGEVDGSDELSYELRFVDGTVYMRMPDVRPEVAGEDLPDAEWITYADGEMDEMAAQLDQLDFGATLQALRDGAEVTEDGRETIAGVATTKYVGTTTLRSFMVAQGTSAEQFEEEAADFGPGLDKPMPLTVWIGDDGLVRRFDYTMGAGGFETTQSMTVLEYGLEVDITAPPAELTMSAEEFETLQDQTAGTWRSGYADVEEFESGGTITLESEGSATAERSATAESVPAPTAKATTDSDG